MDLDDIRRWVVWCCLVGIMLFGKADPANAQYANWNLLRPPPPSRVVILPEASFWGPIDIFRPRTAPRPVERDYPYGGPVTVRISLGAQIMTVSVGGEVVYRWPISSGRIGYTTPHGTYGPQRLAIMWRSKKYHYSPMPYSIFFRGGYAIHGTYETAYLGARASHGCIRLSPAHAATLFSLVRGAGFGRTRIVITG